MHHYDNGSDQIGELYLCMLLHDPMFTHPSGAFFLKLIGHIYLDQISFVNASKEDKKLSAGFIDP